MLICTCDHSRKEHIGGTLFISNYKVDKCQHENCTCKKYHSDKATKEREVESIQSSFFGAIIIIAVFVGVAAFLAYGTGSLFEDYTITKVSEFKTVYLNGSDIPDSLKTDPKEKLVASVQTLVAIPLGYGGFIVGLLYGCYKYEARRKILIAE